MQWIVENQPLLLAALGGVCSGALVVGWWIKQKMQLELQQQIQALETERQLHEKTAEQLNEAQKDLDELDNARDQAAFELKQTHGKMLVAMEKLRHMDALRQEKAELTSQTEGLRAELAESQASLREQEARHQQAQQASEEKLALLENAEARLKQQFEHLANQLFENKTAKVDQQNRQSLEGLLNPLKDQIEGFKKQVTDSFSFEAKERHTLVHELKNLQKLNEQMSREALNLTQALKGDNKQQGNWGRWFLLGCWQNQDYVKGTNTKLR